MIPKNQMSFPKIGKQRKQRSLPALIRGLDDVFSQFIRLRDADSNGICRCITCGKPYFWKQITNGHFVTRDRFAVRWHEQNCNAQCVGCNGYHGGEQFIHGQMIDLKHGKGTADMLRYMGKIRGAKISAIWIEMQIGTYRKKVKELLAAKAF